MLPLDAYAPGIPDAALDLVSFADSEPAAINAAPVAPTAEKATPESLSHLITRELPKLKRLAWMLVRDDVHADDLVQDTIVRVLTYAHNWQPGTNFGAWVKTIMRNQFYTECSQRSREAKTIVPQDDTHDEPVAPVQDARLVCSEMNVAIKRLPKNQRVAITLAAFEGLNSEEIAARMGISPNAARCHLMRARKQLREMALASKKPAIQLIDTDDVAVSIP